MAEITEADREWEAYTKEPESMCVGTLNRVVRDLREAIYQEKLKREAAVREALDARDREWREALWLAHVPDTIGLYGDDGEMQCVSGPHCDGICDFKRQPIADLIAHVRESIKRQAEDQQARRVFASLCKGCKEGRPAEQPYADFEQWTHPRWAWCSASDVRNAIDPTGRLAEPQKPLDSADPSAQTEG